MGNPGSVVTEGCLKCTQLLAGSELRWGEGEREQEMGWGNGERIKKTEKEKREAAKTRRWKVA